MILMLYRLAWKPVWWIARALAAVSSSPPSPTWPASWRLAERTTVDLPTESPRSQRDDRDRTTTTRVTSTYWLHAASLGECK
ncbi:MAG TPA: hypothetical protein VKZ88_04625, partial [Fibrobacteria bacterium]|nr:hypothetical protein [Fibrobacteria bacterium]